MTAANPAASGWIPAKQFIAGEWRQGRSEKTLPDINPSPRGSQPNPAAPW